MSYKTRAISLQQLQRRGSCHEFLQKKVWGCAEILGFQEEPCPMLGPACVCGGVGVTFGTSGEQSIPRPRGAAWPCLPAPLPPHRVSPVQSCPNPANK